MTFSRLGGLSRLANQLSWLNRPRFTLALSLALWCLGLALIGHVVAVYWSVLGADLKPVYLAGRALVSHLPLYTVEPGPEYVYLPSNALMLGAPLSALPFATAARIMGVANALLIVALVPLAARIFGRRLTSLTTGLGVALLGASGVAKEAIGLVQVSVEVAFLGGLIFLAWSRKRHLTAAVLLGVSLALKPLLLPLCIGLVFLRHWRILGVALAVAAIPNLIALAIDPVSLHGAGSILNDLLRDRGAFGGFFYLFNSSLLSIGHLLDWSAWLTYALRVLTVVVAGVGIALIWRTRPEPARSVEAGGLLLAGFYLASSDLEAHWLLVLVPFAFAAVVPASPVRNWAVLLGGIFALELITLPAQLTSYGLFGTDSIVLGFSLLLVVAATAFRAVRTPPREVLARGA